MKKITFSVLLIFILNLGLTQALAPFQLKDEAAITITNEVLATIIDQKWYTYERDYYERDLTVERQPYFMLKLKNDYTYEQQSNWRGTWSVRHGKILYLKAPDTEKKFWNNIMLGGFSIHHCSKDKLILVKNLTSSFDNKMVYYFEPEALHKKRKSERIAYRKTAPNKMTEKELQKMNQKIKEGDLEREGLIHKIKTEAFMRKIKIKENLFDLSEKDLINYLEKIKS